MTAQPKDCPAGSRGDSAPSHANLLLLPGSSRAGGQQLRGHAQDTVDWVRAHTRDLALVVNTRWHSDHVGPTGCCSPVEPGWLPAASTPRPSTAATRLLRSRLPRPARRPLHHRGDPRRRTGPPARRRRLQVVSTPGHTPGHLCLWQPEERLLAVGDALSDYDVGWVNLALDGPDAAATALASCNGSPTSTTRPADRHGPIPADTDAALAPHTSPPDAWSRTPTEPSGTAPAGSSPSP